MKKILILTFFALFGFCMAYSQKAQKPKVMIMPSKNYCIKHSYGSYVLDADGKQTFVVDYDKALQNEDLRIMITATEQFFQKNGFPLENLAGTLEKMAQGDGLRAANSVEMNSTDFILASARPDIYVDLDFNIIKQGPRTQIQKLNIEARDAATTKLIFGRVGDSSASPSATLTTLLQEVVNSYADAFLTDLTTFFTEMFNHGRQIEVVLYMGSASPYMFTDYVEIKGKEYGIGDLIDRQLRKNAMEQALTSDIKGKEMHVQMRAPIFREEEDPFDGTIVTVPVGAKDIGEDVRTLLNKREFFPFKEEGIDIRVVAQGVGIVNVFIGGE